MTVPATFTFRHGATVSRIGFGAMRITGRGVWGPPTDENEAIAVLRRAVDLGVNFIDTADSYGPDISETLIAKALHPYPAELLIASKGGFLRPGPGAWTANGRPAPRSTALIAVLAVLAGWQGVLLAVVLSTETLVRRRGRWLAAGTVMGLGLLGGWFWWAIRRFSAESPSKGGRPVRRKWSVQPRL